MTICSGRKRVAIALVLCLAAPALAGGKVWPRRNAVVEAIGKSAPAVVNISTERIVKQRYGPSLHFRRRFFDDPFRDFFKRFHSRKFKTTSLGSGVIIDPDGYVVTNEHVVTRASKIHVNLQDGTTHEGELISSDADTDLAVVKIDVPEPLPAAKLGTSSDLMMGETLIAIGNPFGFESSVSVGVVSAVNRTIRADEREVMKGLIQTDAAINPGNSGGALVNINGELVGLNTAIYAKAQNIGFAVPVDKVKLTLGKMLDYRSLQRMTIGVDVQELTPELAEHLDIEPGEGVLVANVTEDSPADEAGIESKDLIIGADNKSVTRLYHLRLALLKHEANEVIRLKLRRDGQTFEKKLVIDRIPPPDAKRLANELFGLGLQTLTPKMARHLNLEGVEGMIVTEVERGGPADKAGVRSRDLITQIGGLSVVGDNFGYGLETVDPGDSVYFVLIRNRTRYRGIMTAR